MITLENQSSVRSMPIKAPTPPSLASRTNAMSRLPRQASSPPTSTSSVPTTPNFVKKFQSNFCPLDLRKITFSGNASQSQEESFNSVSSSPSTNSSCTTTQSSSGSLVSSNGYLSREGTPKRERKQLIGAHHTYHSSSQDSFMLKRQSSQNRLRESLLASLLSPRTKEIEFTVPQTLSPLTPTFGRKGLTSGDSSPASLSGSRSEMEHSVSRANTPSPLFFTRNGAANDIGGCFNLGGLNPELYKTNLDLEEEMMEYPQNHVGRVWFGLEYDTESERLIVALIKARNLPESRSNGSTSCNPFVRVALFPDERRTLQSKPKKNSKHPHFNETFGFQISQSCLSERSVKFSVYDIDENNKKHSLIGYFVQPLKDIDWSLGKQVFKEDLVKDNGELSPNIGEILVSLCYNGNISRLTVSVYEARGIKSRESATGLYCKIVLTQNAKVIKSKKTEVAQFIGCGASFKESFNFKLGAEMLDSTSITINLVYAQHGYNKPIMGQDPTAGRIVLGSFMLARGKGLDHWTEMVSKQKEQIQYWHAVSE